MILVRLRHLPPDAAVPRIWRDGADAWTRTDVLLADVWRALTGSKAEHPALLEARRVAGRRAAPERQRALAAARARAAERRRAIAAGEIT